MTQMPWATAHALYTTAPSQSSTTGPKVLIAHTANLKTMPAAFAAVYIRVTSDDHTGSRYEVAQYYSHQCHTLAHAAPVQQIC